MHSEKNDQDLEWRRWDGRRAWLVCVGPWRSPSDREARRAELAALARSLGLEVVGQEARAVPRVDRRTWLGAGAVREVGDSARAARARVVVVDAPLSPSQGRHLEAALGLPVLDREGLILSVFEQHARTPAARLQVEAARLAWLRPRARGFGRELDQQAGGVGRGKGPGETATTLTLRRIDDRIARCRRALDALAAQAATRRAGREGARRVVLVGATNAGKTTLMNGLTGTALPVRDRPFETLDTTTRALCRRGSDVVLSDTVGFVRDLPEHLLEAFASTLAEVQEADLLVVVVDVADPVWPEQAAAVVEVLRRLDADNTPRLWVFNQVDRAPEVDLAKVDEVADGDARVLLSAHDAAAVERLREVVLREARGDDVVRSMYVPWAAASLHAAVRRRCRVLTSQPDERGVWYVVQGERHVTAGLAAAANGA